MTHVATLLCNPSFPSITEDAVRRAVEALMQASEPAWLDEGIAVDLPFTPEPGADIRATTERLRAALGGAAIDVVVQEARARRKKLLLADMDSTMIEQECIDELAAEIGKKQQVAAMTDRAMRGEIAFESALAERVALLRGIPVAAVSSVLARKITLTPGGPTLVGTMRRDGAHCVLVSGGFTLFTEAIAAKLGFHEHRANELLVGDAGELVGRVAEPVLGKAAKVEALIEIRSRLGLSAAETLAVGDGANDLAMLLEAGLGIAYHAKPAVAAAARARVDCADLTALLYVQGYKRAEIWTEPRRPLSPADWKRKYGALEKAHERTRFHAEVGVSAGPLLRDGRRR
jgi:phosphoserine phosphatase